MRCVSLPRWLTPVGARLDRLTPTARHPPPLQSAQGVPGLARAFPVRLVSSNELMRSIGDPSLACGCSGLPFRKALLVTGDYCHVERGLRSSMLHRNSDMVTPAAAS